MSVWEAQIRVSIGEILCKGSPRRRSREAFPDNHGFSVEKTAARGEARLQVPVCGFLSRTDGRMHEEMVSLLSVKLPGKSKLLEC